MGKRTNKIKKGKEMIYTIPKGTQFSFPRTPKFFVKELEGTIKIVQPVYELDNGDQLDWNKVTGISSNPLKPDQNALLIAWRWNPEKVKVEIAPYFNRNSERLTPEVGGWGWLTIPASGIVNYKINYQRIQITDPSTGKTITVPTPPGLKINYWTSFRVQPYFGGDRNAPEIIIVSLT